MQSSRRQPVTRSIRVDGVRVSYLEQGIASSDRSSIVLLHGLMGCAATFTPLLAELAADPLNDQHVIALDLPGAGGSERNPKVDASLTGMARTIGHALDALGLVDPVLLGHSHGGTVAMMLAATQPDRLRSLVLLAPAHPYFREGDPVIRFYLTLPGRLFAYSMPWYPQWMQMFGLRRMAGPKGEDTAERLLPYRENLRTPGTMRHLLRLLRSWKRDMADLGEWLRRPLDLPCLLLWGDADRAVPVASAAPLRAHMLRSELHVLPGVGHRPAEEVAPTIARMLMDWMLRDEDVVPASPTTSFSYKPNSSRSHRRIASLRTTSFDPGD